MANRVRVTLTGEGESAEAALRGVERRMERVSRQTRQTQGEMRGLNRVSSATTSRLQGLAGAAGMAAGAAGIGWLINSSLRGQEELHNLHKTTGISIERIQEYQFAARKTGIEQQRINDALAEMSQRMGEAVADFERMGRVTEMGEGFQAAGIGMRELQELNPTETFDRLATAIQEAESEQAALNIAVKAFGDESGRSMVSMLREGEAAINKYIEQAHELGIVLDEDVIKQSVEAKKSITTLTIALESQLNRAVAELAPSISELSNDMADWIAHNEEFIQQDLPATIRAVGTAAAFAVRELGHMGEMVKDLVIDPTMAAGEGAARAIYGSADSTQRLINERDRVRAELERVQRGMENIPESRPQYDVLANRAEELRQRLELLNATLERERDQLKKVTEADRMLWEEMARSSEQKDRAADTSQKRIRIFEHEAASVEALARRYREAYMWQGDLTKAEIGREQALRGGRPPVVGPREFGDAKGVDPSLGAVTPENLERSREEARRHYNYLEEFSRQTAQNMQRNFSNFFFDAWTGELDSASDYFESFGRSLLRTWADIQSRMLAKGLFGGEFMGGQSGDVGGVVGSIASMFGPSPSGGGMTGPPQAGIGTQNTLLSYDTGGTLPEDIYGFGSSGTRYKLHEGETVQPRGEGGQSSPQINLTIVAADAKSFSDMAKRNPQAIIGPVKEALNYGDMDLRNAVRGA